MINSAPPCWGQSADALAALWLFHYWILYAFEDKPLLLFCCYERTNSQTSWDKYTCKTRLCVVSGVASENSCNCTSLIAVFLERAGSKQLGQLTHSKEEALVSHSVPEHIIFGIDGVMLQKYQTLSY